MFSMENTAAPIAPALDELVPSRYALKVGDVEVLVISDGVLPLPTQMLGHNVPAADRAEWFEEMYLPQDAFDWALNVMVVHSGAAPFSSMPAWAWTRTCSCRAPAS